MIRHSASLDSGEGFIWQIIPFDLDHASSIVHGLLAVKLAGCGSYRWIWGSLGARLRGPSTPDTYRRTDPRVVFTPPRSTSGVIQSSIEKAGSKKLVEPWRSDTTTQEHLLCLKHIMIWYYDLITDRRSSNQLTFVAFDSSGDHQFHQHHAGQRAICNSKCWNPWCHEEALESSIVVGDDRTSSISRRWVWVGKEHVC